MKTFLTYAAFLCAASVAAQKNTVASGGMANGSGGSVSFSVGQIDYIQAGGSGGTAAQGVQQAYEIYISTGSEEKWIELNYKVYPNPTTDIVTLNVENRHSEMMKYTLISVDGKVILSENISSEKTDIPMQTCTNGIYFLNVSDAQNKIIKSFKIIKH